MTIEKGNTYKILRDKQGVSTQAKEQLKAFNQSKRRVLEALKESDLTVIQLAKKLEMPQHEAMYLLLSLVKFGFVETGEVDDMDEYFSYKLKEND